MMPDWISMRDLVLLGAGFLTGWTVTGTLFVWWLDRRFVRRPPSATHTSRESWQQEEK